MSDHPDRILRKPAVRSRTGFSDTTLWRRVKDGEFPPPIQISKGAVGWLESEIDAWLAKRVAERSERQQAALEARSE